MSSRTTTKPAPKVIDLGEPGVGAGARTQAALALRAPTGMLPAVQQELFAHVRTVIAAGLMPGHVKTPEQAVVLLLKGRELGMQPMQALASIYVVNGLPSLKTEAMLALAYQRVPELAVEWQSSSTTKADVVLRRGRSVFRSVFTMEDAKRAGLAGKDMYRKWPADMLRWRALAAGLRVIAPDVTQGMLSFEELASIGAASPEEARAAVEATAPPVVPVDPDAPSPAVPEAPEESASDADARDLEEAERAAGIEGEGPEGDDGFDPEAAQREADEARARERAPARREPAKPAPAAKATASPKPAPPAKASPKDRAERAFRDLVDSVTRAGIHSAAPNPETAATRFFFDVTKTTFGPRARAVVEGKADEGAVAALLADLAKAKAEAEKRAKTKGAERQPGEDDLPF